MNAARPTLMVMAGGTGGHVFPALAVANELRAMGTQISWLGTQRGLEASVVPANDISINWISVEGMRGKSKLSLLLAPFKILRAMWQSARVISRVQPDCILGMGGFVAGPGGLVARLMGRPLVVHEQNAVAGLTNKYLAKIANRVLTGFPNVVGMPATARWVGNPVRESIMATTNPDRSSAGQPIKVLVIGGSQGAHSFNKKLPAVFAQLGSHRVEVWHQSGRDRSAAVTAAYDGVKVTAKVSEFIDDMNAAYQWADLLICRAGAMTIAECCAAAKPALLIPYPFSAGDHQVKNAEAMVAVGGARMLANEQIADPIMIQTLTELLDNRANLAGMGSKAHTLHKPHALADVVQVCWEYLDA